MMYFILTKKNCIAILLAILFLSGGIIGISHAGTYYDDSSLKIIVDAGHGIPDGGAVGTLGSVEQSLNLSIAKKLEEVLSAKGVKVIMTRSDDSGLWTEKSTTIREKKVEDMKNRLKIMSKSDAELFITIHMNSHTSISASGLRIFYSPNHSDIKPLAENIQSRMSAVTGAKMSIVKTADKSLYLLKKTPIPAILVECGFLSNPAEEKKLLDDDYQSRLAWAIADAIEKYYTMQ